MSELRADTITASDGTSPVTLTKQHAAKAHAHYDQVNDTVEGSFGISSITDNATGEINYNVTNAFNDAHYTTTGSSGALRVIFHAREDNVGGGDLNTTSIAKVEMTYDAGIHIDMTSTNGLMHGDLA